MKYADVEKWRRWLLMALFSPVLAPVFVVECVGSAFRWCAAVVGHPVLSLVSWLDERVRYLTVWGWTAGVLTHFNLIEVPALLFVVHGDPKMQVSDWRCWAVAARWRWGTFDHTDEYVLSLYDKPVEPRTHRTTVWRGAFVYAVCWKESE